MSAPEPEVKRQISTNSHKSQLKAADAALEARRAARRAAKLTGEKPSTLLTTTFTRVDPGGTQTGLAPPLARDVSMPPPPLPDSESDEETEASDSEGNVASYYSLVSDPLDR